MLVAPRGIYNFVSNAADDELLVDDDSSVADVVYGENCSLDEPSDDDEFEYDSNGQILM